VQANAEEGASLSACLRACTPAWQYTTTSEREDVEAGRAVEWGAVRTAFTTLAARVPGLFSLAIRMSMSVHGYHLDVTRTCNALNEREDGTWRSPIVLCTSSAAAFGERLHDKLRATRGHGAMTMSTARATFLLAQSVAGVSSSNVAVRLPNGAQRAVTAARRAAAAAGRE
jgi:hypothetical protein